MKLSDIDWQSSPVWQTHPGVYALLNFHNHKGMTLWRLPTGEYQAWVRRGSDDGHLSMTALEAACWLEPMEFSHYGDT